MPLNDYSKQYPEEVFRTIDGFMWTGIVMVTDDTLAEGSGSVKAKRIAKALRGFTYEQDGTIYKFKARVIKLAETGIFGAVDRYVVIMPDFQTHMHWEAAMDDAIDAILLETE